MNWELVIYNARLFSLFEWPPSSNIFVCGFCTSQIASFHSPWWAYDIFTVYRIWNSYIGIPLTAHGTSHLCETPLCGAEFGAGCHSLYIPQFWFPPNSNKITLVHQNWRSLCIRWVHGQQSSSSVYTGSLWPDSKIGDAS